MFYFYLFLLCVFFKVYLIDYTITVFPIFPLYSPSSPQPQPSNIPPFQFMFMGCTYKFFESSISYTTFYLSPSILCLLIMLLFPCTFSPLFLPSHSPLKSLHVMSISLILFLFQLFAQFVFVFKVFFGGGLGSLDSCEFVVNYS